MYYFAYGSNMLHQQMKDRCPHSVFIRRAFLNNYKFVYDGCSQSQQGAVGNVIKLSGQVAWGGLFEITEECLKQLDKYEGYPNIYDRIIKQVQDDAGKIYDAVVYFRTGEKIGIPSTEYRKVVMAGARDCGIDNSYIWKYLGLDGVEQQRLLREAAGKIQQNPTYQFYSKLFQEKSDIDAARTFSLTREKLFQVQLKAACIGESSAMWAVANMYLNGEGVAVNLKKSIEWRQKAAEFGDTDAMIELARRHSFFGSLNKSENDYTQATVWYRRAAEAGRPDAMYRLAWLLVAGPGVEKNVPLALHWLRKAAEAGHGDAMHLLALCYRSGRGIEQNDLKALVWHQKAAASKNSSSMYELAELYYHGHIVAQDKKKALEWYKKASDHGHKESQKCLKTLSFEEHEEVNSQVTTQPKLGKEKYNLSEADWDILLAAKCFLTRIVDEVKLSETNVSSISKVLKVLDHLPGTSPDFDISITVYVRDESKKSDSCCLFYLEWWIISVHKKWLIIEMWSTEDNDPDSAEYAFSRVEYYPGFESYQIDTCGVDVDLLDFSKAVKDIDLTDVEVEIEDGLERKKSLYCHKRSGDIFAIETDAAGQVIATSGPLLTADLDPKMLDYDGYWNSEIQAKLPDFDLITKDDYLELLRKNGFFPQITQRYLF